MKLYFLRHGIAEERSFDKPDAARRLTTEGIEQMEKVAEVLKRLGLILDLIVTSPLPRASETALIVAKALGIEDRLKEDTRLEPGFQLGDLQKVIEDHPKTERIMLVGHEPDFGWIAGQLIGGAALDVKKGGLIRIEIAHIEPGLGILQWFLTPKVLIMSENQSS